MSTLSVDKVEPVGSTLNIWQRVEMLLLSLLVLTTFTNSGTATGFGGLVAQVLQHSLDTSITTTSTSYVIQVA